MKKLLALVAIAAIPMSAMAVDTSDGCGLGHQVMQGETLMATSVRLTTNAFVPPTFGMTSGTIGCNKHEIASNDMEKANYAVTNFDALKVEMASGQGEMLNGFAKVMGCDASAFGKMTKAQYSNIYKTQNTSAVEMYKNVKALAANQCSAA